MIDIEATSNLVRSGAGAVPRTTRSCTLYPKGYVTYPAGAAFGKARM